MDMQAVNDTLGTLWARFSEMAARAEAEAARNGGTPDSETRRNLDAISDQLDKLEMTWTHAANVKAAALRPIGHTGRLVLNGEAFEYDTGTAEHARFMKALRTGMRGMTDAEAARVKFMDPASSTQGTKAMHLADDTLGGYLASGEFANDVLRAMTDASPVRQAVRVVPIVSGTGGLIPVRTGIQTAKRISETGTRVTSMADLAFKLEQVPTPEMFASTVISRALVQDSAYPLDAELRDAFVQAARLLEGYEFIKGTALNGEMQGLDTASLPAANIVTCADSSGHLVGADDLHKLLYQSLKAAYIPGARLLMNPKMLGTLRMLKATTGNTHLFPVNDPPGYLAGVPYVLMPDLSDNATPAAGNAVAYLLNPVGYTLVVRQDILVQRLVEKFVDTGQLGFYIYQRVGGQVVLADALARLVTA